MNIGKACSQAGHAYLQAYKQANSYRRNLYDQNGLGTKICLSCPTLDKLLICYEKIKELNIPCALIEDTGRNTTFNGIPTISALGIGPVFKNEVNHILKKFNLFN